MSRRYFSAEASEHREVIRKRIVRIFERCASSPYCLRAAVKSGDLSPKSDCDELAGFLIGVVAGRDPSIKAERTAVLSNDLSACSFRHSCSELADGVWVGCQTSHPPISDSSGQEE